jgi:hypothetical protein
MYTPITKRVKVAQHKSSVAKQTATPNENSNQIEEEDIVQNEQGDVLTAKATGNKGTFTPPEKYEGPDACEDPNSAACENWKSGNERCKKDPNAAGCEGYRKFEIGKETPGDSKFSYEKKLSEGQRGSSIDLFSPQELRSATRAGKVAARNVKKASKQYERMQKKFNKGKISQKVLDAYKNELDNTVSRSENIGEQAKGMRNRYITQRMEHGRKLESQELGGQPVKAPKGTKTQSDFESDFNKRLGINGGSSNPQATTTPTSSFSEMAAALAKPIKLDTSALFTGNLFQKGQKKSPAFKMKGYGSNR